MGPEMGTGPAYCGGLYSTALSQSYGATYSAWQLSSAFVRVYRNFGFRLGGKRVWGAGGDLTGAHWKLTWIHFLLI